MHHKKILWSLVLCLTLGTVSPAAAWAVEGAGPATEATTGTQETTLETTAEHKEETPAEPETSAAAGSENTETEGPGTGSETDPANESSGEAFTEAGAEAAFPGGEEIPDVDAFDESAADLVAEDNQKLITLRKVVIPQITHIDYEFRFLWMKDAPRGFLKPGAQVYEDKSEKARVLGRSIYGSVVYILADSGQEWVYVESGITRGFVKGSDLSSLDRAAGRQASPSSEEGGIMDVIAMVMPMHNQALTYTRTTAYDPVAKSPTPAIAADEFVAIYDRRDVESPDAVVVGTMKEGDLAYVLADKKQPVVYVESGDVRGFAEIRSFVTGSKARKLVRETGADTMGTAEAKVPPRSNPALYYTLTSVKEASREAILRYNMVDLAVQYKEGKYVWGGKHLQENGGVDCSGFTQEIYRMCGLQLPRSAQGQSLYGIPVPVEAALPGDIIAYAKEGVIYHVGLYIGEEMTVQARDPQRGIQVCEVGENAVWACRVIGTQYEKSY